MVRTTSKIETFIPTDLVERARNAAVALDRPLAGILTDALRRELARIERTHGGPFPPRTVHRLRRGRRKSTGKRAG